MGTWGVGVFGNDIAVDIRDDFRDLISAGYPPEEATDLLVASMSKGGDVFEAEHWVPLAMTQWRLGRLLPSVLEHALAAIDAESEDGHSEWTGGDVRKRATALAKARETLLSPQRDPVKVRPPRLAQTPFVPGDIVRYTCKNGREIAMWAAKNRRYEGVVPSLTSTNTVFKLLALGDPALPPVEELVKLEAVVIDRGGGGRAHCNFSLEEPQDAQGEQWDVIANVPYPWESPSTFGIRPPAVKARASSRDGTFDAFFTDFTAAGPNPDPRAKPTQQIIDAFPAMAGMRCAWIEAPPAKVQEIGMQIADLLDGGGRAAVASVLEEVERLLGGDRYERAAALRLLDVLLCNASHPEVSFGPAIIRSFLGPRGHAAIDQIDAAWSQKPTSAPSPLPDPEEHPAVARDAVRRGNAWRSRMAHGQNRHITPEEHVVCWRWFGAARATVNAPVERLCDDASACDDLA